MLPEVEDPAAPRDHILAAVQELMAGLRQQGFPRPTALLLGEIQYRAFANELLAQYLAFAAPGRAVSLGDLPIWTAPGLHCAFVPLWLGRYGTVTLHDATVIKLMDRRN